MNQVQIRTNSSKHQLQTHVILKIKFFLLVRSGCVIPSCIFLRRWSLPYTWRDKKTMFIYVLCYDYHVARVSCTFCLFTLLDKSFKKCDRYIYLSLNNFKTFVYFYIIIIRIVSIYFIKIAISLFFIILGWMKNESRIRLKVRDQVIGPRRARNRLL